jgi:hypothetical protein
VHHALGGVVVARVGATEIPGGLVSEVARARAVTPKAALDLLLEDAVLANGALAAGLDRSPEVVFATRSIEGRATIAHVRNEANATAPTDEEVSRLTKEHWLELDCPETLVVIHAVVLRPTGADAAALEVKARQAAAALEATEQGAKDADDFEARAKAVPHDGLDLRVERLQPFTTDGRVAAPGPEHGYDAKFAAGAAPLMTPGATSGIVESSYGWHVIRLLERRPRKTVPLDERRRIVADEAHGDRARAAVEAIEARAKAAGAVTLANGLDELLSEAARVALPEPPVASAP